MAYEVIIGNPAYNVKKYVCELLEFILAETCGSVAFLFFGECGFDCPVLFVSALHLIHNVQGVVFVVFLYL